MKKKNLYIHLVLSIFIVFFCSCQPQTGTKENEFPVLEGEYLGQTPPGRNAELFAPGIISTGMNDRDIAISPDLDEIYYSVLEEPHYTIVCVKKDKGRWTKQEIAPFSGQYNDCEPQFSPDGRKLYFCSTRPLENNGEPKDYDIWYMERTGNGWGEPKNPGSPLNTEKNEFYPSITSDGTIYFTSHDMNICRSRWVEGKYMPPEKLGDTVNTLRGEYNSYVAPDESYLIFTSHGWDRGAGRGDLFVCFRLNEDVWTKAVNLGPEVNSNAVDMCPTVSPDGKYLFFSSMRKPETFDPEPVRSYNELIKSSENPQNGKMDIYWVDAVIIQHMKPEEEK
ncbi:MAG: PD40 domain-containing protein [Candidatus Aminicenantes bacterium]|nr:PD40 domain-containing protein [Candidatus Aminicenantes bacterium]